MLAYKRGWQKNTQNHKRNVGSRLLRCLNFIFWKNEKTSRVEFEFRLFGNWHTEPDAKSIRNYVMNLQFFLAFLLSKKIIRILVTEPFKLETENP